MSKKTKIIDLLHKGYSYKNISGQVKCSMSTIAFHAKKLGLSKFTKPNYSWQDIQSYNNARHNRTECKKKFGFSQSAWDLAVSSGKLKPKNWIMPINDLLVQGRKSTSRNHLKQRLLEEGILEYKCAICGISTWQNQSLTLELEHKNGDKYDNRLENICLLCPNCHSQTPTYGSKNKRRYLPRGVIGNTLLSESKVSRFEP